MHTYEVNYTLKKKKEEEKKGKNRVFCTTRYTKSEKPEQSNHGNEA